MKDQYIANVQRRLFRMKQKVILANPHLALMLVAAEERREHPLLYVKHKVIETLQRYRSMYNNWRNR
jgi:hypothetical protein